MSICFFAIIKILSWFLAESTESSEDKFYEWNVICRKPLSVMSCNMRQTLDLKDLNFYWNQQKYCNARLWHCLLIAIIRFCCKIRKFSHLMVSHEITSFLTKTYDHVVNVCSNFSFRVHTRTRTNWDDQVSVAIRLDIHDLFPCHDFWQVRDCQLPCDPIYSTQSMKKEERFTERHQYGFFVLSTSLCNYICR